MEQLVCFSFLAGCFGGRILQKVEGRVGLVFFRLIRPNYFANKILQCVVPRYALNKQAVNIRTSTNISATGINFNNILPIRKSISTA